MKRDMDLARQILLQMELESYELDLSDFRIGEYSREMTGYHVYLLADAGLIVGVDCTEIGQANPCWAPSRITWAGHEFLDASRNETIWNKAKSHLLDKGVTVTFGLLTQCLTAIAKAKLGIL